MRDGTRKAFKLCMMALVNYVLFYGISVFLSRTLGTKGFEQYSVAVAYSASLAAMSLTFFFIAITMVRRRSYPQDALQESESP